MRCYDKMLVNVKIFYRNICILCFIILAIHNFS